MGREPLRCAPVRTCRGIMPAGLAWRPTHHFFESPCRFHSGERRPDSSENGGLDSVQDRQAVECKKFRSSEKGRVPPPPMFRAEAFKIFRPAQWVEDRFTGKRLGCSVAPPSAAANFFKVGPTQMSPQRRDNRFVRVRFDESKHMAEVFGLKTATGPFGMNPASAKENRAMRRRILIRIRTGRRGLVNSNGGQTVSPVYILLTFAGLILGLDPGLKPC